MKAIVLLLFAVLSSAATIDREIESAQITPINHRACLLFVSLGIEKIENCRPHIAVTWTYTAKPLKRGELFRIELTYADATGMWRTLTQYPERAQSRFPVRFTQLCAFDVEEFSRPRVVITRMVMTEQVEAATDGSAPIESDTAPGM